MLPYTKKRFAPTFIIPFLLVLTGMFSLAQAGQATSGKLHKSMLVWGSFIAPASLDPADGNNAKFEIFAKPTFRLRQFNKKTKLVAYVIVAALRDRKKLDYNSKVTYGIGVEVQHKLTKAVRLSFGAKWDSEYQYFAHTTYRALVATADMSVYKSFTPDWLRRGRLKQAKLVLSGWGNIRYPGALDPTETHNALAQGALKLAMVIPLRRSKLKIAPYGALLAKADIKGRPWNNTVEPSLGIDLKIPIGKGGVLSLGAKKTVQFRHATGKTRNGVQVYLSWYKNYWQ
jgi:hypothetical protein